MITRSGGVTRLTAGAARVEVPVHLTARRADGSAVDCGSARTDSAGRWTATTRSGSGLVVTATALGATAPQVPVAVRAALTRLFLRRNGRAALLLALSARVSAAGAPPMVDVVLGRGASVVKVLRSRRGTRTRDRGTPAYLVSLTSRGPLSACRVALRLRATALDSATPSHVTAA